MTDYHLFDFNDICRRLLELWHSLPDTGIYIGRVADDITFAIHHHIIT